MSQVRIGDWNVGSGAPCFIIAEIGINHNGSIEMALALIDAAASAGADAVKFQKRDVPIVYSAKDLQTPRAFDQCFIRNAMERSVIEGVIRPVFPEKGQRERLEELLEGKEVPTFNSDLKYALEFGPKEWDLIRTRCEDRGVAWGVSAWDGVSVFEIDGFQPDFHKVASACLTHADLLRRMRCCNRPIILSTGGSTFEQVRSAIKVLGKEDLVLLHCVATYPSTDDEGNLSVMESYRNEFHGIPVGYSGHEEDTLASRLAVSIGATVVERHITLDRNLPGSDQKASIEPQQFRRMVDEIRLIETMRGTQRSLSPEKWAKPGEMERISALMGLPEKKVLLREIPVMEKLRRIRDY